MCKFCGGSCACHINPPCHFCETHEECSICGQQVCESVAEHAIDKSDWSTIVVCPDCIDDFMEVD